MNLEAVFEFSDTIRVIVYDKAVRIQGFIDDEVFPMEEALPQLERIVACCKLINVKPYPHPGGGKMGAKVCITQDCKNGCGMKVETLLGVGDLVPEPRECVSCESSQEADTHGGSGQ